MHCYLWFRSVFRVRGPWPKRYGYHLSIIYIYLSYPTTHAQTTLSVILCSCSRSRKVLQCPRAIIEMAFTAEEVVNMLDSSFVGANSIVVMMILKWTQQIIGFFL